MGQIKGHKNVQILKKVRNYEVSVHVCMCSEKKNPGESEERMSLN